MSKKKKREDNLGYVWLARLQAWDVWLHPETSKEHPFVVLTDPCDMLTDEDQIQSVGLLGRKRKFPDGRYREIYDIENYKPVYTLIGMALGACATKADGVFATKRNAYYSELQNLLQTDQKQGALYFPVPEFLGWVNVWVLKLNDRLLPDFSDALLGDD